MTAHAGAPPQERRVTAPDACTRTKQPKLREAVWEVTEFDPCPQRRVNPDDAPPRDRLLENAVRIAAHGGIGHLSLRQLALELGTSHRMVIHHLGSRDGLVAEIVRIVQEQQRSILDLLVHNRETRSPRAGRTLLGSRRGCHRHLRSAVLRVDRAGAARQAAHRQAARRPGGHVDRSPCGAVGAAGHPSAAGPGAHARLGFAAARGLLLDLLVTGDRARVDAAMELLARMVQTEVATAARPPGGRRPAECALVNRSR